jgi:hypothetical protein
MHKFDYWVHFKNIQMHLTVLTGLLWKLIHYLEGCGFEDL